MNTENSSTPSTGDSHLHDLSKLISKNTVSEETKEGDQNNEQILFPGHRVDELANNDGSILETLDVAFHNKAGILSEPEISGSDRAQYYEEKSQGQSDADEEQEYMKSQRS